MRFIQVGRFLICRGLMSQVFSSRGVEQPGSSSGSKPEGRWFKSSPRNQFFAAAVSYRVYVIRSRDGKFYIGLSDDVHHRVNQHNVGESKWTRGKGPWTLIWQSQEMCLSDARKLELLLKRQKGGDGCYKMIGLPRIGS